MLRLLGIMLLAVYSKANVVPCACSKEYKPICGNNGVTYRNICEFSCAQHYDNQLTLVKVGDCLEEKTKGNCVCTYDYAPVCGTDSRTYPNECSLECQRATQPDLEFSYTGECNNEFVQFAEFSPCVCTRLYSPVCGNDGVTYSNPCLLRCAARSIKTLKTQYEGICLDKRDINPCTCERELNPVCGSNKVTYANRCMLECAQKDIEDLFIDYDGHCVVQTELPPVSLPCACTRELKPMCGSNGITYSNLCMFQCAVKTTKDLELKHEGNCRLMSEMPPISFPCVCTADYLPVCGSNGITYGNNCMLDCAMKETHGLTLQYQGPCKVKRYVSPCVCTREFRPVCGSNGRTYSNPCMLRCAAHTRGDLYQVHEGAC